MCTDKTHKVKQTTVCPNSRGHTEAC